LLSIVTDCDRILGAFVNIETKHLSGEYFSVTIDTRTLVASFIVTAETVQRAIIVRVMSTLVDIKALGTVVETNISSVALTIESTVSVNTDSIDVTVVLLQ